MNHELDITAGDYACKFCKFVNSKRKSKRFMVWPGIDFNGSVVRDRDHTTDGWCNYFKDLFTSKEDSSYDEQWKNEKLQELNSVVHKLRPDADVIVLRCYQKLP